MRREHRGLAASLASNAPDICSLVDSLEGIIQVARLPVKVKVKVL
jgi:hypothetical protein